MDVCLLCLYVVLSYVGRGLCDGLITRRHFHKLAVLLLSFECTDYTISHIAYRLLLIAFYW
jgi:hypothetical protein